MQIISRGLHAERPGQRRCETVFVHLPSLHCSSQSVLLPSGGTAFMAAYRCRECRPAGPAAGMRGGGGSGGTASAAGTSLSRGVRLQVDLWQVTGSGRRHQVLVDGTRGSMRQQRGPVLQRAARMPASAAPLVAPACTGRWDWPAPICATWSMHSRGPRGTASNGTSICCARGGSWCGFGGHDARRQAQVQGTTDRHRQQWKKAGRYGIKNTAGGQGIE